MALFARTVLLGALEAEVMDIVWTDGEVTVHDVSARLRRPRAYTTVQTTLERLLKKGILARTKQSHAFVYSPRIERAEYAARVMVNVFPRSTGEAVLSAFVDLAASADPKNLERLEALIDARRRSHRPGKGKR